MKYGTPISILTDQGSNFLSEVFKSVCKLLRIKKLQTTAFHPESNGSLERSHHTLGEFLRNYCIGDPLNWDDWIPFAMFVYNTSTHCTTGFTPIELVLGHKATLPTFLVRHVEPQYNYDSYVSELKYKLQVSHNLARENTILQKNKQELRYDKSSNTIEPKKGDLVLLTNESRGNRKLKPVFVGPFKVISINSKQNTTILIGKRRKVVHNNRLKMFVPR